VPAEVITSLPVVVNTSKEEPGPTEEIDASPVACEVKKQQSSSLQLEDSLENDKKAGANSNESFGLDLSNLNNNTSIND